MTRLYSAPASEAGEHAKRLFAGIKASVGTLPNAYLNIGTNSPQALEGLLFLDAVLKQSSLPVRDSEVVKLVVSELSQFDYCLGAHTFLGKRAGLDKEQILAIRRGKASGDARIDSLSRFTRKLLSTQGPLPEATINELRFSGIYDAQIVDIVLAITSITFTNLFNRINDTAKDFPPADEL
ncbi:carboxymuconolactone decarboxylase family protein [Massilia sp. IC2-477]|uniref:carboxymuconolactone decarboxylase family protein n=1 Tax=Massilia sp. IC2-477 TaxID=2887198 RepID=UPI001D112850|nr:carboxymuconolactone decarboxylase family protein [Massilia sp. IC2-477]MCC2954357.1 carboxymuconolactone decarboxylase family protein [Massilia sp. IC2-477]